MVIKSLLIVVIIAILMDDSSSIRKTEEEKREEKELAEAVNKTLAEEEKKKAEEEKKKVRTPDEKKKEEDEKKRDQEKDKDQKEVRQCEDCLAFNVSCPIIKPCPPQRDCPEGKLCEECPPCKSCPKCEEPKECPPVECPPVFCPPCPVINSTRDHQDCPSAPACSGTEGMSVPVALAVGACAGVLVTGMAAIIGIVIRYFSPLECGFLVLAVIIIVWYFSSQYPATARELGGQAANLLREAATALGHRIMAAIRHHDQVSLSNPNPLKFEFHVHLKGLH
jgi:hypothetical protein